MPFFIFLIVYAKIQSYVYFAGALSMNPTLKTIPTAIIFMLTFFYIFIFVIVLSSDSNAKQSILNIFFLLLLCYSLDFEIVRVFTVFNFYSLAENIPNPNDAVKLFKTKAILVTMILNSLLYFTLQANPGVNYNTYHMR